MMSDHAKKMPIFWGHGKSDPLVKFPWAEQSIEFMKKDLGIPEATKDNITGVEFHAYPGLVHSANDEELDDLQEWLTKVLPTQD